MKNRGMITVLFLIFAVFGLFTACEENNSGFVPNNPNSVPTYTVSFEADGGSPVPQSQTVSRGGKVTEPAPMVRSSNPSYSFFGWRSRNYINQNNYSYIEWDFDVDTVTADITLYADWRYGQTPTYTVKFEANGGTPAPSQQSITSGSKLVPPSAMNKSGYGFDGWYKEEDCINQWDFTTDTVTKKITLYAKWNANYSTVIFEANGGSPAPSQQNIANGRTVITPPTMTKPGYSFGGWYTETDYINQWDFTTDTVTGNIALYAKWNPPIIIPGANWNAKMRWLDTATNIQSNGAYIIEIDSDENISPITFSYSGKNNISITMKGIESVRTLNLSTNGSMFTVESGVTLILGDNLELQGRGSNSASLIRVKSGANLILNQGTKITRNSTTASGNSTAGGGGVYLEGGTFTMSGGEISGNSSSASVLRGGGGVHVAGGTFTMSGGEISGNSSSNGGGVFVSGGTFTMSGGEISGNTSSHNGGGGVHVAGASGTFSMSGGEISGNTSSNGGGVYVGSGYFAMSGGEISGNTASSYGGGVYVSGSYFIKTGGTIFGYSEGDSDSNVVKNSNVVQQNRGHAIHFNNSNTIYIMGKDTTSGTTDNFYFNGAVSPPLYNVELDY